MKKMRGVFIYYGYFDKSTCSGIDKKVHDQIELFNKNGLDCNLCVFPYNHKFSTKILDRIPYTNTDPHWSFSDDFKYIDYIYLRRPFFMGAGFIHFLKKIKTKNNRVKIIVEIPTYPYDGELNSYIGNFPLYIKDKINRRKLYKYIDRLVIVGNTTNIKDLWGIPVVWIMNGINCAAIPHRNIGNIYKNKTIHCICVSSFEFWHGYDRLLEALGNYYQKSGIKRNIVLHMVGDGAQKECYDRIVKKYNLQAHVKFEGMLHGERLDKIYDCATLAIECLGMYRKNMELSSSLKSREYLAKGLPIVAAGKNDVVEKTGFPYYLELSNDDSSIDIEEILQFYDRIYPDESSFNSINQKIRDFAEKYLDLSVTMKEVLDYLKGENI